ncbi:maleylpyruvate isomerase family mycothiol-dependent enzyme [Streptomyces sp. NPDC050625]|uniref:maleylpyruvate isomerase family mycothiol-dependent enzyme n=1 Tax=Streptomyces sp. NPDC050625 TaxID=3154629 RepID=UPI0034286739
MARHPRTFIDARRWAAFGTDLLTRTLSDDEMWLSARTTLPDWNRRQLLAHLAGNADALGNLVRWAATGERADMYDSPQARAAGIARGLALPADSLLSWLRGSAEKLNAGMDALTEAQWCVPVVTAQGRSVPAYEIPWMRAREVLVHFVDLADEGNFADLPVDFLRALCDDVIARRSTLPGTALLLEAKDTGDWWKLPGEGVPVTVTGPLHEITAYLTGRPHNLINNWDTPAPRLGPWL